MSSKSVIRTRASPKPTLTPVRRQPKTAQLIRLPVQPALHVGSVSDPAEREAETMAARVVGASAPSVDTISSPPSSSDTPPVAAVRRNPEDQPNLDSLQPEPPGAEQQDFDLPAEQDVSPDGLGASDMSELESGKPADTSGDGDVSALRRDAGPKAAVGRMGGTAPSDVTALVTNPGPGRPLPSGLRARVEPHFQRDFSDVRLHDRPADQDAAARIGARAFTHRNSIWLGRGESPTNTRLMAHELTHVVQQTDGSDKLPINRSQARRDAVQREPIRREEDEGYIAGKLESYARYVPGYTLTTVILGKKLISGVKVERTAENLLAGIFGLHPLGTVLFDKLRETRMVQEAYDWTVQRLGELNLSWSRVSGIIDKIWDAPWTGTKDYIINLFKPIVRDLLTFAKDVGQKVLEFAVRGALKLAGPYADKVWGIIQQAKEVINLIIEDPLQFAKNLIKAIVGGFGRFASNILEHLKKGLLGWLFGAIAEAGITMPEKLDFKGLMSLVMQILGLTYANFRKQLVKKLGPSGERKVAMIEKSVEIVKILLKEGFAGIWKKMLEMIENFKSTLIGGISTMVITTIVKAGLSWLAGLSNPIGGVVKVVLGIYDMIVAFLERLEQIMAVAQSIFSSVGAIARGQTDAASKFVEETIGRTVPVVIAFLAAALGLGGISSKIKSIINKLQAPVQKAMGKLIGFVIKKMKKLFSKIVGKLNGKRKLPSVNFKVGNTPHRYYAEKKGKKIRFMIASKGNEDQNVLNATKKEAAKVKNPAWAEDAKDTVNVLGRAEKANAKNENTDLTSEKKNQQRKLATTADVLRKNAEDIQKEALEIDKNLGTTSDDGGNPLLLIRSIPARMKNFEGLAGTYDELKGLKKKHFIGENKPIAGDYELDHTIEKQYAKRLLESLNLFDSRTGGTPEEKVALAVRDSKLGRKALNKGRNQPDDLTARRSDSTSFGFGQVGSKDPYMEIKEAGGQLPAIALHRTLHNDKKAELNGQPPNKLIQTALKKDNPRGYMRAMLRQQMKSEYRDIISRAKSDPTIDETIRNNIKVGLDVVMDMNAEIFQFDGSGKPDAEKIKPNDQVNLQLLTGNKKIPNFSDIEGEGRFYDNPVTGIKGFLENDHILDQGVARRARDLKLFNDAASNALTAAIANYQNREGNTWTREMADRAFALITSAKLYPSRSGIGSYRDDGKTGWTVAIHKSINERVKAQVGAPEDLSALATMGSGAISGFVRFITETDRSKANAFFAMAAEQAQIPINKALKRRTQAHAQAVQSNYDREIARVVSLQTDAAQQKSAQSIMNRIVDRVRGSLAAAHRETENLLPKGPTFPE